MRNETMIAGSKTAVDAYYPRRLVMLFMGISSIITVSADHAARARTTFPPINVSVVHNWNWSRELTSRFKRDDFPQVKLSLMRDRCSTWEIIRKILKEMSFEINWCLNICQLNRDITNFRNMKR